jgi:hypothetical protein
MIVAPSDTADQADGGPLPQTALTKKNQTYCSKLVRFSQATPTETAKAGPA